MLAKINAPLSKMNTINFNSLKVRLTLGIALLSSLGLGTVALWMSLRMQSLLMMTHKQTVESVTKSFPHDVKIYSEMVSTQVGIQKTINNLSSQKNLFWFKDNQNEIIAQSPYFPSQLAENNQVSSIPKLVFIDNEYWLMCGIPIKLNQEFQGNLYLAQNVTNEQLLFGYLIRSLTTTTILAVAIMIAAIAFYIAHSLKPLEKISNLAKNISVDQLKEVSIDFHNSPHEVKTLAETLEKMLIRLGESWDNQKQLLSDVSHELRTPLTIVSGYLQSTLRRGDNLTSIQQEALSVASSEADRTIKLLEDLLELARADNGRININFEIVIINDLIREIISMAQEYSHRNINLSEVKSKLKLRVDRDSFKQICLNLIDNAIKYSPENTDIDVNLKANNSTVTIEFCDQGFGIPLTQQNRIFERFYRVDEARNRAGGTGLGLAIVKTLVTAMNGEITVSSQINKGSIFTVKLPNYTKKN